MPAQRCRHRIELGPRKERRCRRSAVRGGIHCCLHRNKAGGADQCPVCLDPVPQLVFFRCSHGLCRPCRGQLRDPRCPLCRADNSAEFTRRELALMAGRARKDRRADLLEAAAADEPVMRLVAQIVLERRY